MSSRGPVTLVTYHYVRPLAGSRYPEIKGLEIALFREQLAYFGRHYNPISIDELVRAWTEGGDLPPRPLVLTFDDGYSDHYLHVLPALLEQGMSGAFYPPASALFERRVLDVNKIQFVLASTGEVGILAGEIEKAVEGASGHPGLRSIEEYRESFARASRFDPPEVMFVKKMLQSGLPEEIRIVIVDRLFARFVTSDERGFAEELYLDVGQLREMAEAGMHIGSHGSRHVRLSLLSPEERGRDIADSLRIFRAIGRPGGEFTFCYPYGDNDAATRQSLREAGCVAALTTTVGLASPGDDMLGLPRLDTNDLPKSSEAEANGWTRKVREDWGS
jgi:peptidoglycan/xylan/chitin deacetylase (PgdA/CDA1 family)